MIKFLVCAAEATGRTLLMAEGKRQIAANRFIDEATRDDIRVVRRYGDLSGVPGGAVLIRGPDYDVAADRAAFERLVETGGARWDA